MIVDEKNAPKQYRKLLNAVHHYMNGRLINEGKFGKDSIKKVTKLIGRIYRDEQRHYVTLRKLKTYLEK